MEKNMLPENGQSKMGKNTLSFADSRIWKSIEKTVSNFFLLNPGQDRSKIRVVDLGCYEGDYTVEFAKMGFDAIGIDARAENIEKCNHVKEKLNLPNLNFIQDDVRNFGKYGKFDITICYGLLYHLDDPINFINLLSSCTTKMLLLNTHYAPERDLTYGLGMTINRYIINPIQKRIPVLNYRRNYKLSNIEINEGVRGRWYWEWSKNEKKDKIEKSLWASYNNYRSFWPCKKDLIQSLHKAGFDSVFEQFDFIGDELAPENYQQYLGRGMFVCFKH